MHYCFIDCICLRSLFCGFCLIVKLLCGLLDFQRVCERGVVDVPFINLSPCLLNYQLAG